MTCIRYISTILILSLICNSTVFSVPIDYDNDLYSDPSTVVAADELNWISIINGNTESILSNFGELGQHLVPGMYDGANTLPATLYSDGTWLINNYPNISYGEAGALYVSGADFDGNSFTDLSYATNACKFKKSKLYALLNPLSSNPISQTLKAGNGRYFKFFYDSNSDGSDDFCTLKSIKASSQITNKFRAVCRDVLSKRKVKSFDIGRVYAQPLAVKVTNSDDLLLVPQERNNATTLRVYNNNGTLQSKIKVEQKGTIIIANFTSLDNQQIAIVKDQIAYVYDPVSKSTFSINYPEGIPYDEINIVNFENNENCFCTSRNVQKNKTCRPSDEDEVDPVNEGDSSNVSIPNNCSNPPSHISSNDGFKCISSSTRGGSVVCLLPYQFTWKPFKSVTDHHNFTFSCNKNDSHFDKVELVLDSGERINLGYAGCHNYVATVDGPIGRQHFRNEGIQWSSIKNQVRTIEMTENGQKTCLKF